MFSQSLPLIKIPISLNGSIYARKHNGIVFTVHRKSPCISLSMQFHLVLNLQHKLLYPWPRWQGFYQRQKKLTSLPSPDEKVYFWYLHSIQHLGCFYKNFFYHFCYVSIGKNGDKNVLGLPYFVHCVYPATIKPSFWLLNVIVLNRITLQHALTFECLLHKLTLWSVFTPTLG